MPQAGADPCQASQLRIADIVPPTYPLKEAMDSGEADAAGTAMARHLARLLQQHAPLQLSREAALIAAVFAAQQHDNQAVQAFVAAAAAAPPTPPHAAQRSGSMPAYSWPLLFGWVGDAACRGCHPCMCAWLSSLKLRAAGACRVAVREGLGDVAAAVLAHMSPAERQQELSSENAVWAAMGGHEGLLRQLVEAGAPFGLAEREQALYWGIEMCSPDAVRLALSWGGGPAELVQHCQAATAQAAVGAGPASAGEHARGLLCSQPAACSPCRRPGSFVPPPCSVRPSCRLDCGPRPQVGPGSGPGQLRRARV